jgi:hypothetical protein
MVMLKSLAYCRAFFIYPPDPGLFLFTRQIPGFTDAGNQFLNHFMKTK